MVAIPPFQLYWTVCRVSTSHTDFLGLCAVIPVAVPLTTPAAKPTFTASTPTSSPADFSSVESVPVWFWAVLGVVIVLVLLGMFLGMFILHRHRRTAQPAKEKDEEFGEKIEKHLDGSHDHTGTSSSGVSEQAMAVNEVRSQQN